MILPLQELYFGTLAAAMATEETKVCFCLSNLDLQEEPFILTPDSLFPSTCFSSSKSPVSRVISQVFHLLLHSLLLTTQQNVKRSSHFLRCWEDVPELPGQVKTEIWRHLGPVFPTTRCASQRHQLGCRTGQNTTF